MHACTNGCRVRRRTRRQSACGATETRIDYVYTTILTTHDELYHTLHAPCFQQSRRNPTEMIQRRRADTAGLHDITSCGDRPVSGAQAPEKHGNFPFAPSPIFLPPASSLVMFNSAVRDTPRFRIASAR